MVPVHPGGLLRGEIEERGLNANQLALALRVPSGQITEILNGKRGLTAETSLRFAVYFGNSAQFWMNMQSQYELALAERKLGRKIAAEVSRAA